MKDMLNQKLLAKPILPQGVWLTITDSHDVQGFNDDGFTSRYSYLYLIPEGMVLFDRIGSGCIRLIRTIGYTGDIIFEIDGNQRKISFTQMYSGKIPEFPPDRVSDEERGHGSAWAYVDIQFQESCRVIATDKVESYHFFNIWAHLYQDANYQDPDIEIKHVRTIEGKVELLSGQNTPFLELQGNYVITKMRVWLEDEDNDDFLEKVRIKAWWDDLIIPAIDAPPGLFFATGYAGKASGQYTIDKGETKMTIELGRIPTAAHPVGKGEDNSYYCVFPMPFWTNAKILAQNSSQKNFNIKFEITIADNPYLKNNTGYFHARYHREANMDAHRDFSVASVRGSGRYLGCALRTSSENLSCLNNGNRLYLEGDARFYIDDSRSFLCGGTGTEEYFNWGWYDIPEKDKVFTFPFHGYPEHSRNIEDHSTMYRFHITDDIPFYRSFSFQLEHGPEGITPADYSSVAFYYLQDEGRLVLSDVVDIADLISEERHNLKITGSAKVHKKSLVYQGNDQVLACMKKNSGDQIAADNITHTGTTWQGECKFNVAVDSGNRGIKLRRIFDSSWKTSPASSEIASLIRAEQAVDVYIDGELAGRWYSPPNHACQCWTDEDFEIPACFTANKSNLQIQLVSRSEYGWNNYQYHIYSYVDREVR